MTALKQVAPCATLPEPLSVSADGAPTITRNVRTAYSYLAANDPRIHVGLGNHTGAEGVTVRWVDGTRERFDAYEADQIVTLRSGSGMPVGE